MIRPGHHRPLGTTATMRFEWTGERLPQLGDVAFQISAASADDADHVRRAYRVVGILEGRSYDRFKLVLERLGYDAACDELEAAEFDSAPRSFEFFNLPRNR